MSKIQAYANNAIQRKNEKDEVERIDAKEVFETTAEQFAELEALGAVRKATTGEIAEAKEKQAKKDGTFVPKKETTDKPAQQGNKNTGKDAADKSGDKSGDMIG